MLAADTRLGPYRVVAPLGAGGMGEVYRAQDTRLGRDVAVKILPAARAASPEAHERFAREARTISSLSHPNICVLHDVGTHEGFDYLVMEMIEGETLAERLARGRLKLDEALRIATQMAAGLAAAHHHGIVHRDLKPGNVMLTKAGVKILDFGVAKLTRDAATAPAGETDAASTLTSVPPLTTGGEILGTVQYMAPEQLEGKPLDHRADIFAFGAVLYEMLTGQRAFPGRSQASIIAAILEHEPRPLVEAAPGIPPALDRAVRRCLAKDPEQRWQDAFDLGAALADARGDAGAEPVPDGRAGQRDRRRLFSALAATLLVLLALAAGLFVGRRTAAPRLASYHGLSFQSGYVHSARFAPDQQTVVYGGAFEGRPVALFSTRADAYESRALDLPSADVAGISSNGDMAVLLNRHHVGSWLRVGTLARVALAGGSPRPILEDVYDADISPDGQDFAVVRMEGTLQVLEYPLGHVLARTEGWFSQPRISRDGKRVAYADHPFRGDDLGIITVVDREGHVTRLSRQLNFLQGLCWSPSGDEVWATGGDSSDGTGLWSAAPGRPEREMHRYPGSERLLDAAPNGQLLMAEDDMWIEISGRLAGDSQDRPYSWWSDDSLGGISDDGRLFTGDMGGFTGSTGGEYLLYYRRNDGQPPVRLGPGATGGVSPDGRWVVGFSLSKDRSHPTLYPTGPGEPRRLDLGRVEVLAGGGARATFSNDGRRLAFIGSDDGRTSRTWVLELAGGAPRAVSPAGITWAGLSPDGRSVAEVDSAGRVLIQPVDGGEARPVAGALPGEVPLEWDAAGRGLYMWDQTIPARIWRLDLTTGARALALSPQPVDAAGILYGRPVITQDAQHYLVRYRRVRSYLVVVSEHRQ